MKSNEATQVTLDRRSLQQRMLAAKKRRQEQLNQYLIREKTAHNNRRSSQVLEVGRRMNSGVKVSFDPASLLFEAVIRNDLGEVRQLLKSGAVDKEVTNSYGMTPLHQSCIDQNLAMIHLLVKEFSADLNESDQEHWTPLHTVALFGFADIAKFLLDNGADALVLNMDLNMAYDLCNQPDTLDVIEAHMATTGVTQEKIEYVRRVGERKILKEMHHHLSSGRANLAKYSGPSGESLLHIACANGYYEVASFLIRKAKHPISCFDNDLWQPIHAAAYWQQVKVMELLLTNGADIYVKTNEGENPMDLCRDKEFKDWMVHTYHNKKGVKSQSNAMRSLMKKSGSSAGHHFDSSVSLTDLNKYSLSTKRLNTERKDLKKKKDKADEYHRLISSRDHIEDDDENEYPYHRGSLKPEKQVNLPRSHANSPALSEKTHQNHLKVPSYAESPNPSEHSLSWKDAVRQMHFNKMNSERKGSDQSQNSKDSRESSTHHSPTNNHCIRIKDPSALILENGGKSVKSKRSKSVPELTHQQLRVRGDIQTIHRKSVSEKRSKPHKRCIIS